MIDIIDNIMLISDLKTIASFSITNKIFNSLYNKDYFWQRKFNHDYLSVLPNSLEWKKEYEKVYKSNRTSKILTDVLIELVKCQRQEFYTIFTSKEINIFDLYFLPHNMLNIINREDSFWQYDDNFGPIQFECEIDDGMYIFHVILFTDVYDKKVILNKQEFIDFFTKLLYKYKNLKDIITDFAGNPFLYNDLISCKYDDIVQDRLNHWYKIKSYYSNKSINICTLDK